MIHHPALLLCCTVLFITWGWLDGLDPKMVSKHQNTYRQQQHFPSNHHFGMWWSLFIAIDQLVDLCNYRFRRVIGNDPCMYLVFILPATVCCVSLSTPSVNQLYFPAVTSQSINILSELMSVFGPLFDQDNQDLPSLELMMSFLPTIFFITAL